MFFDNKNITILWIVCRAASITVPIIPGIKPLALMNQITILPKLFSIDIPEEFAAEVRKCKTNDEETSRDRMGHFTSQGPDSK